MPDQDLYSGLIRLHVLYHASAGVIFGLGMIRELQHHGYRVGPGTLYPMLHRMQERGYLQSEPERVEGKIRRVYRITARGRAELREATVKVRELYHEMVEGQGEPSPAHPNSGVPSRGSRGKQRLKRSSNEPLGGGEGHHLGKTRR